MGFKKISTFNGIILALFSIFSCSKNNDFLASNDIFISEYFVGSFFKNSAIEIVNNTNKDITSNDKCVPRVRANADRLQPILSLIPNLSIDSKTIPTNFDATKVAEAIKKSNKFLINVKKLSFFLAHYDDILKGVFDDYGTGKVKDAQALVRRNYTQEQLDEIFADMDDYDKLDL